MQTINKVLANVSQGLSSQEQAQARANIGAAEVQIATGGGGHGSVTYSAVDSMAIWPSSGLVSTTVGSSTDTRGYIAPYLDTSVTQNKVFAVQTNSSSPTWVNATSLVPLQLLNWSTIVASNNTETIYVEDGTAYSVDMTSCPGLVLDTTVTDHPVHTIIEMYAEGASGYASCPSWTVSWLDETTAPNEITFTCSDTDTEIHYRLDVTIQKLWSGTDRQYYTVARVLDFPAYKRDMIPQQYSADNSVLQVGASLPV